MDEAAKYQQRLQAIAERRRQQEEEKRLKRETEEEWFKTVQDKRKYLREQWLSETAPAPVLPSLDDFRPRPPQQDEADEHTAAKQPKSQKTPEDKKEAADARKEEQDSQEEIKESINCAARARSHYQAGTDEDVQVNKEAEHHFSVQMAQRMFHESGQDGRSVLGTLAVQVERDPKTGATVVKSVAPVSAPAGAPTATTVFDDGRKSIHAVGGVGGQPSTEELGQILSVIDGVGMKVLLDEVTVTPNKAGTENIDASRAPEGKVLSFSTHHASSDEDNTQSDSCRSYDLKAERGIEDCAVSMGNKEDKKEDRSIMALRDIAGEVVNVEDQRLEEGPVTLLFLGYADDTTDQDRDQEDYEGMLTAERVIITEEGEEHVLGPETSPQAEKESQDEAFQDIPLEGNGAGVKVQGEEGDKGPQTSSSPTTAAKEGTSKRKTCQCCSVM